MQGGSAQRKQREETTSKYNQIKVESKGNGYTFMLHKGQGQKSMTRRRGVQNLNLNRKERDANSGAKKKRCDHNARAERWSNLQMRNR